MNGSKRRPLIWAWPPGSAYPGHQRPSENEHKEALEAGGAVQDQLPDQAGAADCEENPVEEIPASPQVVDAAAEEIRPATSPQTGAEAPGKSEIPTSASTLPAVEESRAPSKKDGHPPMPGYNDECGFDYTQMQLARAYILCQRYGSTYSPREALERGTLFPDLYSPYPY